MKLKAVVTLLFVLTILVNPILVATKVDADSIAVASRSSFPRCVKNSFLMLDEAKELSPKAYRDLERKLDRILNPVTGILTSTLATTAGFIYMAVELYAWVAFDLVWYVGMIQSCL